MTAPLPNRFYNPVKELCAKQSLDYETVLGTGIQNKIIRDAFLNSEVKKNVTEFNAEDRKAVKHKKEFFARKYGETADSETGTGQSEERDKGRVRYDAGITVEHLCSNTGEMDKSNAVSGSVGVSEFAEFGAERAKHRPKHKWIPGQGVV
jgi:hypothetical protein